MKKIRLDFGEKLHFFNKAILKNALATIEGNSNASIEIFGSDKNGWSLLIDGIAIAEISKFQKDQLVGADFEQNAKHQNSIRLKKREEIALFIQRLILTPTIPRNIDAAMAELIMDWERVEGLACHCHHYVSKERESKFVAWNPFDGCKKHEIWSPSLNLEDNRALLNKPFHCRDGRRLIILGQKEAPKDAAHRTETLFRDLTTSKNFEIVDEECEIPTAICVSALRQIGVNVRVSKPLVTNYGDVTRRFVACMDVLGFKNELEKNVMTLADAYTTAVMISRRTKDSCRTVDKNPGVIIIGKEREVSEIPEFPHIVEVAVFSDSIFVFTDDESSDSLTNLCEYIFLVYREFLSKELPLRGGIAAGEAILLPEERIYLGQAIVEAYKIEQSLDLTGIVLQPGLKSPATAEAEVTFKSGLKQRMLVPTHRNGMANGEQQAKTFQIAAVQAGPTHRARYENSIPVVAAILKINEDKLKIPSK